MAAPLTSDESALFDRLGHELDSQQHKLDTADAYYDGANRLEMLGLAIPPELQRFTVVVSWPGMAADAIVDRLEVKGFRVPGEDIGDAELMRVWRANGMDEQDQMSTLDYQVYGRTFLCVGANEDDPKTPLITVESPRFVITDRDPRTGKVRAALRRYDIVEGTARAATLYLLNETVWLEREEHVGPWAVVDRDQHGMDYVPVVPTFRRRRSSIPAHRSMQGTSVMERMIPLTDAAARNMTNAQLAQEVTAAPQRGVIGATKGDFIGQDGTPLTAWEAYFGAVWALGNKDAKTFQFDAASMSNFETMANLYSRQASGISGLPPNYFGLAADDAASADAIRSREARLVKSAERDQVSLGAARREAMRLAKRIADGSWDPDLAGVETLWYDAGTPTVASRADAVVKMYSATDAGGRPLLPAEAAYEELGYSPARIKRLMEMRRADDADPYLELVAAKDVADVRADTPVVGG